MIASFFVVAITIGTLCLKIWIMEMRLADAEKLAFQAMNDALEAKCKAIRAYESVTGKEKA